jgi:nitrite reductase (NO-forming)
VCHQEDGKGLSGAFPPLANSDYLLEDKQRVIEGVVNGVKGEIKVNGELYDGIMPPQGLSPEETRDVVNYVLNSWGNKGGEVTLEDVKKVKLIEE